FRLPPGWHQSGTRSIQRQKRLQPQRSVALFRGLQENYFAAQSTRMNRLIEIALAQWKRIAGGKYLYTDDGPFNIPGFDNARLMSLDPTIRHTTAQPEKLLKNDGSVVNSVIESVAPPCPELAKLNRTLD